MGEESAVQRTWSLSRSLLCLLAVRLFACEIATRDLRFGFLPQGPAFPDESADFRSWRQERVGQPDDCAYVMCKTGEGRRSIPYIGQRYVAKNKAECGGACFCRMP